MSVKPLDLQVNINALHNITRQEGERMARETVDRRNMDHTTIAEAKRQSQVIEESAESEFSSFIKDTEEHFARTRAEQNAEEFTRRHRKDLKKRKKNRPSENENKEETETKLQPQEPGHFDGFA